MDIMNIFLTPRQKPINESKKQKNKPAMQYIHKGKSHRGHRRSGQITRTTPYIVFISEKLDFWTNILQPEILFGLEGWMFSI